MVIFKNVLFYCNKAKEIFSTVHQASDKNSNLQGSDQRRNSDSFCGAIVEKVRAHSPVRWPALQYTRKVACFTVHP